MDPHGICADVDDAAFLGNVVTSCLACLGECIVRCVRMLCGTWIHCIRIQRCSWRVRWDVLVLNSDCRENFVSSSVASDV